MEAVMTFHPKLILVPVVPDEGDEPLVSRFAVERGLDVARTFGAGIHLLAVLPPPNAGTFALGEDAVEAMSQIREAQLTHANALMVELSKTVKEAGLSCENTVTSDDRGIAHSIIETAEKVGADCVCMPTHGRTGMMHFLLGSVAERVARLSPVPVMLFRLPSEEEDLKRGAIT
jgi:nucleotide-binding universal stress UspA family protein